MIKTRGSKMVGTKAELIAKLNELYNDDDVLLLDIWTMQDFVEQHNGMLDDKTIINAMIDCDDIMKNEVSYVTVEQAINNY
jgi:hypothetical protein